MKVLHAITALVRFAKYIAAALRAEFLTKAQLVTNKYPFALAKFMPVPLALALPLTLFENVQLLK